MLKCVIVDDEQFSIDAIKKYIELLPKLNIVGTFSNPQLALEEVTNGGTVDILFMDIDMPFITGIELAKALRSKTRKLIFTTSHSKYAFDAFEVEADAFLLKPFTFAKFSTTLNRLFAEGNNDKTSELHSAEDYFLVKNKEEDLRIIKVKFTDVVAFESDHNYVKIHLISDKTLTAYLTIKDVLELVAGREIFKQFHRAFVISTDCISYIESNAIRMNNNLTFTIGESFKEQFNLFISEKLIKTGRKR